MAAAGRRLDQYALPEGGVVALLLGSFAVVVGVPVRSSSPGAKWPAS